MKIKNELLILVMYFFKIFYALALYIRIVKVIAGKVMPVPRVVTHFMCKLV